MTCPPKDAVAAARELGDLFQRLYLRFHRRTERSVDRMTPQSLGVLLHLAHAGPLTVGELARHLDRAQSVVSETVDALEARQLLARMRDERDRRRTLVWLTDAGIAWLERQQQVLDPERLARAMAALDPGTRTEITAGLAALLRAGEPPTPEQGRVADRMDEEKMK